METKENLLFMNSVLLLRNFRKNKKPETLCSAVALATTRPTRQSGSMCKCPDLEYESETPCLAVTLANKAEITKLGNIFNEDGL
ncbi:hypothetical protein SFRURICE_006673 [Spodoptera frugiperda]|nr:hypothetical protein SFRURICE_006673 [Spodoptera frugiperda]